MNKVNFSDFAEDILNILDVKYYDLSPEKRFDIDSLIRAYDEGANLEFDRGYNSGYSKGYAAGYDNGHDEGFQEGYDSYQSDDLA